MAAAADYSTDTLLAHEAESVSNGRCTGVFKTRELRRFLPPGLPPTPCAHLSPRKRWCAVNTAQPPAFSPLIVLEAFPVNTEGVLLGTALRCAVHLGGLNQSPRDGSRS